ncbi:MAG: PEP-CTERM sorting domain-containing protein [Akkermansia sp.]
MFTPRYFLACALAASTASADITLTTTFGNAAQTNPTAVTLTNTWSEGANLPEVSGSITSLTNSSGDVNLQTSGAAGTDASVLTPNSNVGTGSPWTLTMAYSSGSAAIEPEIASITLSVVLFASSGQYQSDKANWGEGSIGFTTSLTNSDNSTTLGTFTGSLTPGTGQGSTPYIVTLTPTSPVSLADNTDFKVTLALTNNLSAGTFVGLNSISYTLVPEPTTALLTLPALGALLLRRRRRA